MTSAPTANASPAPAARRLAGIKVGTVVSDKRNKTRTVAVDYQVRHPKYGKYLRRQSRYNVHDEANVSKLGDKVEIANCRPISKTKNWRLVQVVQKAAGAIQHVTEPQAT